MSAPKLFFAVLVAAGAAIAAVPTIAAEQIRPQNQVIATADDDTIIAARANSQIMVHSLAILATSTTSVEIYLYNGDNALFGDGTNPLTVDASGINGPAGIVLPYNESGWFRTDAVNEAIQINMSASEPVIVLINYRYIQLQ